MNGQLVTKIYEKNFIPIARLIRKVLKCSFNIARVSKAEERMQSEHKSVTSVISQAKNVEPQLVKQQEQLVSKENQLAITNTKVARRSRASYIFHFFYNASEILYRKYPNLVRILI